MEKKRNTKYLIIWEFFSGGKKMSNQYCKSKEDLEIKYIHKGAAT